MTELSDEMSGDDNRRGEKSDQASESSAEEFRISRRSTLALSTALAGVGLFSSAKAAEDLEENDGDTEDDDLDVSVDSDRPAGTEALLQLIADEYGDVLTAEQLSELEDDVASNREAAQTLRAFELANGDDMAMTFRAYRGSY